MTEGLKWTVNQVPKSSDSYLDLMSGENVAKANEFHKSFPQYSVTPLQKLSALASFLGVNNIFCKDESYRFGLNAFKVLGGSYAMGRYIAKELGKDISQLPYNVLSSEELRKEFRTGYFLYCYRWQPRTWRCMGSSSPWTEGRCADAERYNQDPF